MNTPIEAAVPLPGAPRRVSVVTVVFNGRDIVERTIASVLEQDYADLEYIVIDGGSTDGTTSVIDRFQHRIACFVSEPDEGVYDAMNKAILRARGEFILFMNAGDVFYRPDSVSELVSATRAGGMQVTCGSWVRRDREGKDTVCRPDLDQGFFNHQAVLYSTALHRVHGLYLTVRGFTAADYLFFAALRHARDVSWQVTDTVTAVIDPHGMSSGLQTFSQKHAINYLLGRTSRVRLVTILGLHPLYYRLKQLIGGRR